MSSEPVRREPGPIRLGEVPWSEAAAARSLRIVALLPVGAIEAHGPHLPLSTDVLLAEGMAAAAAERLSLAHGSRLTIFTLPALAYGVTECAAEFFGTISVRPETVRALVADVAASLARQKVKLLCLVNAHLEPAHRHALREAAEAATKAGTRTLFPDLVRRDHARRLGAEFQSGACHAGSFESSLALALAPRLVRDPIRRGLAANPSSLVAAFAAGKSTFRAAGGPQAYFGDPAAASADEGRALLAELGAIVAEEVERALAP